MQPTCLKWEISGRECYSEQIAAYLDIQAWTSPTGITDVPVPLVQTDCEPFGAQHPLGLDLGDTKLNLKRRVGFNPLVMPLKKEHCACLGLLGNIGHCPC